MSWFEFINSTDFVVKGEVFSAKQVIAKSGSSYVKLGLKVEDTIVVNDQLVRPDKEINIYLGGTINPINVGKEGYFFITQRFGKWFVSDGDIGAWQLNKIWAFDLNGKMSNRRTAPNIFEFPFSVLSNPPDILRQKLRYIDYPVDEKTIVEKMFFTEARLLRYFNNEPCRFDEPASAKINKNIKIYLKSKFPKASAEYFKRINQTIFLSFKDIGNACAFREAEHKTLDYFKVVLVDKETNLPFEDIDLKSRNLLEENSLREQLLWEAYREESDSLD